MKVPLTDIQTSGKHLLRLINNVLDLAKIEAGRMELALADYSVHDTVESVRATLRPLAAEKGLELVATVPADIPLAYGDSGRITQCLMNLAGNSLKFTKAGKVEISVERDGDLLRLPRRGHRDRHCRRQARLGVRRVQADRRHHRERVRRHRPGPAASARSSSRCTAGGSGWRASWAGARPSSSRFRCARATGARGMSAKTILYVEDNELNRKIVRDLLKRTTYQPDRGARRRGRRRDGAGAAS